MIPEITVGVQDAESFRIATYTPNKTTGPIIPPQSQYIVLDVRRTRSVEVVAINLLKGATAPGAEHYTSAPPRLRGEIFFPLLRRRGQARRFEVQRNIIAQRV